MIPCPLKQRQWQDTIIYDILTNISGTTLNLLTSAPLILIRNQSVGNQHQYFKQNETKLKTLEPGSTYWKFTLVSTFNYWNYLYYK